MFRFPPQSALISSIQFTGILLVMGCAPAVAQVGLFGQRESELRVDGSRVHLDVTYNRVAQHTSDVALALFAPVDIEVTPRLKLTYTDPATADLYHSLHPASIADAMTERLAWSTASRYVERGRTVDPGIVRDTSLYYAGVVADMSELNAQTGLPGSPFDSVPAVAPEPKPGTISLACILAAGTVSLMLRRKVARRR